MPRSCGDFALYIPQGITLDQHRTLRQTTWLHSLRWNALRFKDKILGSGLSVAQEIFLQKNVAHRQNIIKNPWSRLSGRLSQSGITYFITPTSLRLNDFIGKFLQWRVSLPRRWSMAPCPRLTYAMVCEVNEILADWFNYICNKKDLRWSGFLSFEDNDS